jgi:hypothetical protein
VHILVIIAARQTHQVAVLPVLPWIIGHFQEVRVFAMRDTTRME